MKSLLKLSSILMILSAFFACDKNPATPSFKSLMIDRDAKKSAVAKKDEDAMSAYYNILESDPELSEVHSNIGVLFMQGKKIEDASKSLNQALKLADQHKDPKAQFVVHYNLGVFYGAQKKVPEALEHYQAALDLNSTSKETKHNIELLIQSNSSDQSKDGDKKDSDQKNKDGKSDDKSKNGKDNKDQKDKDQDKKEDKDKDKDKEKKEDKDGKDEKDKKDPKEAQNSPKYKPRPFQGDQLSEGDVKKILGELKNQEQKIRANFEKKERKENKNEKDW